MTQPSFKFFARAQDVVPSTGAHVVMLSPEQSEANRKIFAALCKRVFGTEPADEFVQSRYSDQLAHLCFHPLYTQHPWLMPAAVVSMMKAFERPREGKSPLYLRYVEAGSRQVKVTYPDERIMKISIPAQLVLSFDYGNKPNPTGWGSSVIELTQEGLYRFAEIPHNLAEAEAVAQTGPTQANIFSFAQINRAYGSNTDMQGLTPDGKRARNRRKQCPSDTSGFNSVA